MVAMEQNTALKILKTGANVFLTGEPGSGKTHTINQYVAYLTSHGIKPAITASTGIAATHIGGMTIHSWCGFGIRSKLGYGDLRTISTNEYVKKRVGPAKILIIDEISMLPPETLGMVDAICREVKKDRRPFGGIQVVLVGDFFQLPPVVKKVQSDFEQDNLFQEEPLRFAYDAPVFKEADFVTCYITEQYRQDDGELLSLLSKIRANIFDSAALEALRRRKVSISDIPEQAPKLYSHNENVDFVNDQMLAKIPEKAEYYPMQTKGHEALVSVMKKGCLSPENLYLKVGAAVMFTKNNQKEHYVNGTLGTVIGFDDETELPIVKTRSGREITVGYADWAIEEDGKVKGKLSQLPLRLAWAITVHKSQGISLDEAVIDLSRVFEYGQGYVALSRVRRLSGIYMLGWNDKAFQVDPEVLKRDNLLHLESKSAEKMFGSLTPEELEGLIQDFIVSCGGEIDIENVVLAKGKAKKKATIELTLVLAKGGMNISQIAKERAITEKTVLGHLEELVKAKKIEKSELEKIFSPSITKDAIVINAAFKQLKTDKLTPVFAHFKGKYSYDEIRAARIFK